MEQLMMYPAAGQKVLRFVGDSLTFSLSRPDGRPLPEGWRAYLRTTLGRGAVLRQEIMHAHTGRLALQNAAWHDIPMHLEDGRWQRQIALTETGYFRAKAYARDARGWQYWPDGPDVGVSIHPDAYRSANTIYCAFVRMFGHTRTAVTTQNERLDTVFSPLDKEGYTIIPPSGKLRDLVRELPHIFDKLGCRILHLLPVTPTPTTYAKFGRYGSPYAVQDLTGIDPALVEFDKRTTGIDQFRELTYAVHLRGGRVFLDVVPNHTGWSSTLHETHPDWFVRNKAGEFASPGAWGTTWEDLVELDHRNPELWEHVANVFLVWCRRGVDGFRCDAGYKIPVPAWEYITARVLDEFPETIFLLEGLGGAWEATENLLTEGGMQWAYSELFQNYSGADVAKYLDYSLAQSEHRGLYVHYSETHDNDRLAKKGREWSLLRNRLCALASVSGGFGFTCGVEWLATEKVNVHSSRGLSWGAQEHLLPELAQLNQLLAEHPCYLDGAALVRQSDLASPVYALSRVSAEGLDRMLVLVNTDPAKAHKFLLNEQVYKELGEPSFDLLKGVAVKTKRTTAREIEFTLQPAGCLCLANGLTPRGLSGNAYRRARAKAAWAVTALSQVMPGEEIGPHDWRALAERVEADCAGFLGLLSHLDRDLARRNLVDALDRAAAARPFPNVVRWSLPDTRRISLVPPSHWLLIEDEVGFRADLARGESVLHVHSIPIDGRHVACFGPNQPAGDARLVLERYAEEETQAEAVIRFLPSEPQIGELELNRASSSEEPLIARELGLALLTNGLGGMARMQVDLGEVKSKYDCVLGANLHPSVPVDRHIFVKRVRVWVVADGFITALNRQSLVSFDPGPPARWSFVASTGDGRAVEIHLEADMLPERNTTVLRFVRPAEPPAFGRDLPPESQVSLSVRVDVVDRNFHWERRRDTASENHFNAHTHPLRDQAGFEFKPSHQTQLRVVSDAGQYHHQAEWCMGIAHPVEASRGMNDHEDAFSPGWFELPMPKDSAVTLTLSADAHLPPPDEITQFATTRQRRNDNAVARAGLSEADAFGRRLALAIQAFVVRRDAGKTVIAGYPWFLDWGRDSLICARGLLSAGLLDEVKQLLITFGRFEANGTLPNSIMGEDTSNRDTSDAPLWYGLACEEAAQLDPSLYSVRVDSRGRPISDVLTGIAAGYIRGTPNGIRMDPASGLVWSPSHFTWMDTNYPAGTPREGYPVEIQALWIRLLRQLQRLNVVSPGEPWGDLAARAEASLQKYFWLANAGYLSDVLLAGKYRPAADATPDTALRSNYLLTISLGLATQEQAQRGVLAALKHLVVPGALRSLAPLPVTPPLPIRDRKGVLLNNPEMPYAARYEGDEDTHRKPAYHNGTAWVWTFPAFCEALARAWDFAPAAVAAARAYLSSMDRLLIEGCAGHLPEITDGDAPHLQRGCDAQSWSATEALRVWKLLNNP